MYGLEETEKPRINAVVARPLAGANVAGGTEWLSRLGETTALNIPKYCFDKFVILK